MTTKLTISRFRTRKPNPVAATAPRAAPPAPRPVAPDRTALDRTAHDRTAPTRPQVADNPFMPDPDEDGFGDQSFLPQPRTAAASAPAAPAQTAPTSPPDPLDAIRQEGLTGRQLRMARRMALKHALPATSDHDAVRLLRQAGIDPFGHSAIMELVQGDADASPAPAAPAPAPDPAAGSRALTVPRGGAAKLPQTAKPAALPTTEVRAEAAHIAEVRRIQRDIIARRRRKLGAMWGKLGLFVFLPTLLAAWYYFILATPMYAVQSKFVIQQATAAAQVSSMFSGTSFATSQDSVAVQGYLQSPVAMERLDKDNGFRAHFSDPAIDVVQRLPATADNTRTYSLYQRYVKVSYDPTEGLINLEVSAATPQKAVEFANALIRYAEDQVDQMTARLRGDQEASAKASFEDAQSKLQLAQTHLVTLQAKYQTLSSEVEAGLVTTQIGALNAQVMQEKLALAQMKANTNPNPARMDPVVTRITTLEAQIAQLRATLTEDGAGGLSIASVQSQMVMATADVSTRQMMLAQATNAMETSRIEAQRQTRYLELAVQPTAPDTASYPRAFENTLVVMLIFGGIYLMISMTVAILREQVSG